MHRGRYGAGALRETHDDGGVREGAAHRPAALRRSLRFVVSALPHDGQAGLSAARRGCAPCGALRVREVRHRSARGAGAGQALRRGGGAHLSDMYGRRRAAGTHCGGCRCAAVHERRADSARPAPQGFRRGGRSAGGIFGGGVRRIGRRTRRRCGGVAAARAFRMVCLSFSLSVSNLVCLGGSPVAAWEAFSLSSAACPFRFAQYSRSVTRFLLPFSKSI